ncbi:MAG: glycoside hydrolase family 6 protein [Polyangia bacterium]
MKVPFRYSGGLATGALLIAAIGCGGEEPAPGNQGIQLEVARPSAAATSCDTDARTLAPDTEFFLRKPDDGAMSQFRGLIKSREFVDAVRLGAMESTPQAVWFTDGSPKEVEAAVRKTMREAERQRRVPVLVAYDVPFRDCAQYSAGGAADTTAYEAWIDGFARGIGKSKAVVILEPDGLGIIPYNTTIYGAADWCKPVVTDAQGNVTPAPGATPAERYAQINYAVDAIEGNASRALVYLDGTHSAWLGVGEAAYRLYTAGVQRAQGFFVNVSNYETTSDNTQFGTWVSDCITAATAGASWAAGHFDWCPSQYDASNNYALNYSPGYAATVTASLQNMLGGATPTTGFVIDTSRNGQGPWTPTASYPDAQVWCNPPGRGLGLRPTASTGTPLLTAYLWIKTPGESDGSCNRGVTGVTTDPEWGGIVDPAAGAWFPDQALQLASLASPALF